MKKNFLFYILITIITLFSFNLNVNAAQELTCVYDGDNRIKVIQNSTGKKELFKAMKSVSVNDGLSWTKMENATINTGKTSLVDSDGNFTKCPKYISSMYKTSDTEAIFYDKKPFRVVLELNENDSSEQIIEPLYKLVQPLNSSGWLYELNDPYIGACRYERSVDMINGEKGIHIIQINYSETNMLITEYDPEKGMKFSGLASAELLREDLSNITNKVYDRYIFSTSEDFNLEFFLGKNKGNCPTVLNAKRSNGYTISGQAGRTYSTEILTEAKKDASTNYYIVDVKGINPITKEKLTLDYIREPDPFIPGGKIDNCAELLGEEITKYLNVGWNIIKFGIPIILLGMGTIDFTQAIFAGKEDDMKKAQGKFLKRVIIAVIIFLIPTVLSFLLQIANNVWGNFGTDICGIIF